jgi:anti-anti-sigma regulatory factor
MLRITTRGDIQSKWLKLDGKLSGLWVRELEFCWRAVSKDAVSIIVDLTDVIFIDSAGRDLLASMHKSGVEFIAAGCMTRSIIEEIALENRKDQGAEISNHLILEQG